MSIADDLLEKGLIDAKKYREFQILKTTHEAMRNDFYAPYVKLSTRISVKICDFLLREFKILRKYYWKWRLWNSELTQKEKIIFILYKLICKDAETCKQERNDFSFARSLQCHRKRCPIKNLHSEIPNQIGRPYIDYPANMIRMTWTSKIKFYNNSPLFRMSL